MKIPTDPIGYLVEANGTIHTRYADHASGQRTRTVKGAESLLAGRKGKTCPTCFPANTPARSESSGPQQRRTGPGA